MNRLVILAAGKGTRMNSELPKVLIPLNGRPMINYLMDSVVASQVDPKPLVVVSPDNKEIIRQALQGYNVEYVIQEQQLGTGHAVNCARDYLSDEVKNVIVLYGDHPFLKSESIQKFAQANPEAVTIMPTVLINFNNWCRNFYHWGRIIRNIDGQVEKIVEFKDANETEKLIVEVNPGFMCFNKQWLLKNINILKNDNKPQEYYLTDMVRIAFEQRYRINTIMIEPHEAMGINSLEELKIAESLLN